MRRADRLAQTAGAAAVEPLDLLASLAAESESRAAELLVEFGVETDRLWAALDPRFRISWRNSREPTSTPTRYSVGAAAEALPLSSDLRLVLNEATMHARGIDRKREVGTEHLLAAC